MKIIVISDTHGNIANIKFVIKFANKIKAGAIIHCGDWDNLKSVEEVLLSGLSLYAVLGNADIHPEIENILKNKAKDFNPKYLEINLDGKRIGLVHNIRDINLINSELDIIFYGHRHFKSERIINGIKIVSPGALHSIEPSFAVYDTVTNTVEFFDL